MYTINSRWVDDKRVTTLVNERVPATTAPAVSSLYPSYVGRDLYFVVKKKLSASLYARLHMYLCTYAFYLPFLSLVVPRLKVRVSMSPLSRTLCTGNPYSPAAFITGGQIILWTRPRDYIDGGHHWTTFKRMKHRFFSSFWSHWSMRATYTRSFMYYSIEIKIWLFDYLKYYVLLYRII